MALCPGLPRWAGTRKVKRNWILLKQETVSGSGISWAVRKSAPCSRQITMPAPHHSVFLQAGCPSCCPTNSVNVQGNNNVSWPAIVAMGKMQMCKSADVAVKISSELRLRLGPGLRLWCHICTSVFHPSRATILRWSVVYVLPNYAFLYMRNGNALITMTNIISRH